MASCLFCQNCGKSVRYAATVNGVTVCEACTGAAHSLPADVPTGQISANQRFVRLEDRWIGRFCTRCRVFCPAGVGDDGLCNECHRLAHPGCSVCGKTPAAPLLGRGALMCDFHATMELRYRELDGPKPVNPRTKRRRI